MATDSDVGGAGAGGSDGVASSGGASASATGSMGSTPIASTSTAVASSSVSTGGAATTAPVDTATTGAVGMPCPEVSACNGQPVCDVAFSVPFNGCRQGSFSCGALSGLLLDDGASLYERRCVANGDATDCTDASTAIGELLASKCSGSGAGGAASTTSTTGDYMPADLDGCATTPSITCSDGSRLYAYACSDDRMGYYADDGRRWDSPNRAALECTASQATAECLGVGSTSCGDTGTSTTGAPQPPASLPGCANCSTPGMLSACYWHPVDFPEGDCVRCTPGWYDCDGHAPEYEGWEGGEIGCETRESELGSRGTCGECGPNPATCLCDVNGNCSGGEW